MDALRAPRLRFTAAERWFFCSAAHADQFVPPSSYASPDSLALQLSRKEPGHLTTTHGSRVGGSPREEVREAPVLLAQASFTPLEEASASAPVFSEIPELPPVEKLAPLTEAAPTALSILVWVPVALSLLAALLAAASGQEYWTTLATAIVLGLSTAWGQKRAATFSASSKSDSERYRRRLLVAGRRMTPNGFAIVDCGDLRPGEEVLVQPGEFLPCDGTVSQGQGRVEMWEGALEEVDIGEGDRVVAGALLVTGQVQVVCSKTGTDRAYAPLIGPFGSSIEDSIHSSRLARHLTVVGAPLVGVLAAGIVGLKGGSYAEILAGLGATWGSLSHPLAAAVPRISARRWLLWAAQQGIIFPNERSVDRAGAVSSAAFCARGTVLHGEPEVAEVHPLRGVSEDEILSLSAGAESVVHHPVAAAVLRAARIRGIEIDSCRSHNTVPGMGVLCVSAVGDLLVIGSRELLLRERISIATAEETLRALESRGLTALMLARNHHLIGVLALQDSLRVGAKAAVQVLLDERIEPLLISGDSRMTTEAVAHALAIEHVRPEVATSARAREVENLVESGGTVAVIGTSPRDDAALGAAPVPVVLEGASISWRNSTGGEERGIGLASRHILAAPLALLTARRIKANGLRALVVSLVPAGAASAAVSSFLVPLYVAPLFATLGAALAAYLCLRRHGPRKDRSHF